MVVFFSIFILLLHHIAHWKWTIVSFKYKDDFSLTFCHDNASSSGWNKDVVCAGWEQYFALELSNQRIHAPFVDALCQFCV